MQSSPYFNEEHLLFRQSVKQFVEREINPYTRDWEANEEIPRSVFKKMGDLGFLGINHDAAFGGTENDFFYSVAYLEELAQCGLAGFCAAVGVHQFMSTAHIAKTGSDFLKERYLSKAISGEWVGGLAISEPNAGSDVANIRTTAVRDGDHFVINGSKTFITNGFYGNYFTVACKTDPSAGVSGISLIVIDRDTPGFTASKLKKIGWHSSDTGELAFDSVRVPATHLVGKENHGFYYIMDSFQLERLVTAIMAIAGAELVLKITLQYIHEREAFGRELRKYQVIRHNLADIATEIEAAKQLTYHASFLYDKGEFAVKECSMAKLLTSEVSKKAADVCLQCFGGYGYMEEYPIARMYRDARVGTIVGGTSEIMKEILAKIIIDDVKYNSGYSASEEERVASNGPPEKNQSEKMEKTPEKAFEIIESLERRFKPASAGNAETVFHFDISGNSGGQYTVNVRNGICKVEKGLFGTPVCLVSTKDKVYEDVELGRSNPQMAVMMGKIKISNLGEMMKFISYFERIKK